MKVSNPRFLGRILQLLIGLVVAGTVFGQESRIAVGIFDTPIDPHYLNQAALKKIPIVSTNHAGESDVWNEACQAFQATSANHLNSPQFSFVDRVIRREGSPNEGLLFLIKSNFEPLLKNYMGQAALYYHGTHVAGIIQENPAAQLIPMGHFNLLELDQISEIDEEKWQKLLGKSAQREEQQLKSLEKIIRDEKIKVINMSFGPGKIEDRIKSLQARMKAGFQVKEEEIKAMAEKELTAMKDFFQELVDRNPQVLFVLAAGNFQENVDHHPELRLLDHKRPHVLMVGNRGKKGELVVTSNFGPQQVDIMAPGEDILSSCPVRDHQQNKIKMGGTSMAAPYVTRELVAIFQENPGLSPAEAKEKLFQKAGHQKGLEDKIQNGRCLP